jgi:hypothetical protein
MPKCRFDDFEADMRIYLSDGCVGFPDDREQDVCATHWRKSTPHGSKCTIAVYSEWAQEILESIGSGICLEHACDHGVQFDLEAAATMHVYEVRMKFPRLDGPCPKGCGFTGIGYASFEHYISGDW